MAIERAGTRMVPKPWGRSDLRPWNSRHDDGKRIGEVWFQRGDATSPESVLLLKLLFTTAPLSIQVHPTDAFAHSIGLPNGKSEAWYVLSATPDARVALGLKWPLSRIELRESIDTGSIAELVQWRSVRPKDVILVPAGTIHAIGPGLVIAEIQQRSDATFRLFDHGRNRELDVQHAVAAASLGQTELQAPLHRLTSARTLLIAGPHFVLERIELRPGSNWELSSGSEVWLFMLQGRARVGPIAAAACDAVFFEADRALIHAGSTGTQGLLAYVGSEASPSLLRNLSH